MRYPRWPCLLAALALFSLSAYAGCDKKRFKIAIDIGHTMNNPGAVSARGVAEFYFNRTLAVDLQQALAERGFRQAFLVNESGDDIALKDRTGIAAAGKADIFLSLHHDSVQPRYLSRWRYKGSTGSSTGSRLAIKHRWNDGGLASTHPCLQDWTLVTLLTVATCFTPSRS